ncbi:hypothetical protein V6N11_082488 [Hibiscus sabdariffa]|uniref:Uncharacterized protein n=1 Tax=Hibiscus sabdariffa TaxID=183260 RepID=A0ABR2PCR6_9ROSI
MFGGGGSRVLLLPDSELLGISMMGVALPWWSNEAMTMASARSKAVAFGSNGSARRSVSVVDDGFSVECGGGRKDGQWVSVLSYGKRKKKRKRLKKTQGEEVFGLQFEE